MNRRSFLTLLGAATPALFLPKLIKPGWKPLKQTLQSDVLYLYSHGIYRPNSGYQTAIYEWAWLHEDGDITRIPWPVRGEEIINGELVQIQPFIKTGSTGL